MLPKEPYKRIPIILFYAAFAVGALWIFVRYALPALSPFIIAYIIAALLQPLMRRMTQKRFPRRLAAALFVLTVVFAAAALCYLVCSRVYAELSELVQNAASLISRAKEDPEFARGIIKRIDSAVPFLHLEGALTDYWNDIDVNLRSAATEVLGAVTSGVLPVIGAVIGFLPGALLYVFVSALSAYYITVEYEKVNRALASLVPQSLRKHLPGARRELTCTLGGMLKAYGMIFLMTFSELFAAFALMRVDYPLVAAFIIAVIDILPVLGAGMILAPWGLGALILGDTARGLALLATFGVMTVIREIVEPRLIGKSIGAHPLLTLVSMYAGLKLVGVAGMIAAPVAVTACRNVVRSARRAARPPEKEEGNTE